MLAHIVPAIALLIGFMTLVVAILTLKSANKRHQPSLKCFNIPLDSFKVYVGDDVPWGTESKLQQEHNEYLKPERRRRDSTFVLNNKNYLLINTCHKNILNTEKVVLAFDVLKIQIDFGDNSIRALRIVDVYSWIGNDRLGEDMVFNGAVFDVSDSSLCIFVAYAYEHLTHTSMCIQSIYNEKKKHIEDGTILEDIKLFPLEQNADKFINFTESAYLIECENVSGKKYDYTIFLEKDRNRNFIAKKPIEGSAAFYSELAKLIDRAKNASK